MAKHVFINANGEIVDKQEEATGARYFPGDVAEGESFSYQIPGARAGEPATMLAVFGAKTLMTNTVSSFYDALPKGAARGSARPRKAEAPATDLIGLEERFAAIQPGDWGAERGGGGGVGYNLDDLLAAVVQVFTESGKAINADKVGAALRDGGVLKGVALDAKAYRKQIISIDGVRAAYEALRAAKAPTVSADDLADDLA